MNEVLPKNPEHVYERDQVVQIINSVISKVGEGDALSRDAIFKELADLKKIIEEARSEIGQARAQDIKDEHIPTATDELDEVVKSTAEATGAIMDSCEIIQDQAAVAGGEPATVIGNEVIKIYEACSFQDITGQRITKVVTSLKSIEQKVDVLLSVLGNKMPGTKDGAAAQSVAQKEEEKGDGLLNGPQMPDKAITQDDIDKLLAEFD